MAKRKKRSTFRRKKFFGNSKLARIHRELRREREEVELATKWRQ